MKKSLFLTMLLALAGCSSKNATTTSQSPAPASATSGTPAAAETYTCSMHPEIIADKPGKCPKCHMDLIVKKQVNTSFLMD